MTKHKLTFPEFPYAEATRKALARLDAMNTAQLRQTFVDAGIVTPNGKLRAPYNGEPGPEDFTMGSVLDAAAEE